MKNTGWTRNGQGFTLIELLVVVAIIALLAALLFPVFSRARESARRSSCLSNLKQIGLGILQYVQDYDERLPSAGEDGPSVGEPDGWAITVAPYIKSAQLYQCPSELRKQNAANPYGSTSYYTDYYYNSNLDYPDPGGSGDDVGIHLSRLRFASNTVLHGDGLGGYPRYGGSSEILDGSTTQLAPRHLEGNNYSFCDGHAKWFPLGKILEGTMGVYPSMTCTPSASTPTGANATFCY